MRERSRGNIRESMHVNEPAKILGRSVLISLGTRPARSSETMRVYYGFNFPALALASQNTERLWA